MIYEIRDYHYRKDLFDEYKAWAEEAVPVLKEVLDVVGFWIDAGTEPEVRGTDPVDSPIGHAIQHRHRFLRPRLAREER